jgi:hypothetical protein
LHLLFLPLPLMVRHQQPGAEWLSRIPIRVLLLMQVTLDVIVIATSYCFFFTLPVARS